jgi:hypothetical protein
MYGNPVIYICATAKLSGVPVHQPNVLKDLEEEVAFEIKPIQFYNQCEIVTTLEQAQHILEEMRIRTQVNVELSNLSYYLKQVGRMSSKQIEEFCKTVLNNL